MKKKWWHDKVAYQIYPKSFLDTNGDGIGDLQGVIEKLDYLKDLGIDLVWLSPCYSSPLADQGYDISDYYNIDPRFGSMKDMDDLIVQARKRGIGIVMDLVVNHCSDEHPWFQQALTNPNGPYAQYFFFEEEVNGHPPNNWRSYFGGSAWEPIPGTNKYYLHLFHKKQPDLNWENPHLREEIYTMINWWLDKGLAGFRIDAIMNIKKALPFTAYNYPSDRQDGMISAERMLEDAKGIGVFLQEMKEKTFARYDAFTVGEVFNEKEEDLPLFIGDNGYFSTMFDFRETIWGSSKKGWYDCKHIPPEEYKNCCFETQEKVGTLGLIANIIENHDEPRGVSRYLPPHQANDFSKKMLGTIQVMLKGIPFLYQGQEIGMENVKFTSIEDVDDISTLDQYQIALDAGLSPSDALDAVNFFSRDNSRTPMQWSDRDHAGFSTSTPWLKLNPNYKTINVAAQINQPNSVLSYYKELIHLRKHPDYVDTLTYGALTPYRREQKNLMAFYRKSDTQTLLVLANLQNSPLEVPLPGTYKSILLNNYPTCLTEKNTLLILQPFQAIILSY